VSYAESADLDPFGGPGVVSWTWDTTLGSFHRFDRGTGMNFLQLRAALMTW
jgi:hypothetical protein